MISLLVGGLEIVTSARQRVHETSNKDRNNQHGGDDETLSTQQIIIMASQYYEENVLLLSHSWESQALPRRFDFSYEG